MRKLFAFLMLLVCLSPLGFGQAWSGILSPQRATDWSGAGVVGDIPSATWTNCTTSACNTLFAGSVTTATIQAALSSCPTNGVVRIPAGNFTPGGFTHSQNNCVLRGAGADQTKLTISGAVSGGGLGFGRTVNLMSGNTCIGRFGGCNTATWTASSYAQGQTVLTFSSTTGLVAGAVGTGSLVMLDQADDASDGYPATGDLYICEGTSNNCSNQGGNNYARTGRAQVEVTTVVAISGNQVTVSPGLRSPNWRATQSPGAYWASGAPLHNAGIENMTIDFTPSGGAGVYVINAADVWVLGTRWIKTDSGTSETYHIFTIQVAHSTIRSNYLYGRPTSLSPFPLANYAYTDQETSDMLVENNIFHHNVIPMVPNDPATGNVFSYNYVFGAYLGVGGIQLHSGAVMMDLYEGNDMESMLADIIHGTHFFNTTYRALFDGQANNASATTGFGIGLLTNNRFFNVVGSVFGYSGWTGYETDLGNNPNSPSFIWDIGWQGNASGTTINNDPNDGRTLMRWANWDNVTNNPRFCGNSSNTGWAARCSSTSEIPSTITNYANIIPTKGDTAIGQAALPASFYLSSKPAWFGSVPFPPIGPDVTGGNVSNSLTGGHAYKIPARVCLESLSTDSAYSSLGVKSFNASSCYGATTLQVPGPPTGLTATPQ